MSRVFNRDVLAMMAESELQFRLNQYRNAIEAGARRGHNTYDLEVEYCYLWTEDEQRQKRREAHAEYVAANPHLFVDENYDDVDYDMYDNVNY